MPIWENYLVYLVVIWQIAAVFIFFTEKNLSTLEPILRLLNLHVQRQRCSRLERFFRADQNIFVFKRARLPVALLKFTTPALQLAIVGLAPGLRQDKGERG
jgi:hypothetical protein